ncbi:hypothetical protein ASPWEDRAFT_185257 [Aspergillus wentii DTO 134E9]|uniref:Uncharacterized protein n=1 Tax=Aspergillus wentii DTO 134E9 TaxID=1073089 RepID=A0A1L9RCW8_ASPWE|nr:uncharacterized protein ASPWEDRAFT_185257 [Aspergillus wentii DTO 134E9]OJJ32779.1 hypothetical protein ASPWEDRAFT_185257 [Aspergillus wentii DTO 134E9]
MRICNQSTLAGALAASHAAAVTQISDSDMTDLLKKGGVELADRLRRMVRKSMVSRLAYNYSSDGERVIIIHSKDETTCGHHLGPLFPPTATTTTSPGPISKTPSTQPRSKPGDAKDPNGVRSNDHHKVYVAWSNHAHFDTSNTGWNDPASRSLDRAFRSQYWWHYRLYVRPDNSTDAGKALGSAD